MSRKAFLWAGICTAAVVAGCATDRGPAESAEAPVERLEEMKLAVLTFGFFNSESLVHFEPSPISYAGMDLEAAQEEISAAALELPWGRPVRGLSTPEVRPLVDTTDPEDTMIADRIVEALGVMDHVVQTNEVPKERAVALKPPMRVPGEWGERDRVLVVLGLETRRRPSSKGLVAMLGCFWFSGEDEYYAFYGTAYDFTSYETDDLIATAKNTCFRPAEDES